MCVGGGMSVVVLNSNYIKCSTTQISYLKTIEKKKFRLIWFMNS